MLTIRNSQIIDEQGTVLKTVSCPKRILDSDLEIPSALWATSRFLVTTVFKEIKVLSKSEIELIKKADS